MPSSAPRWTARWAGHSLALADGEQLIGRGQECQLRIEAPNVSRHHARVRVSSDRLVVEDLGSRNGTWLNGRRIAGTAEVHSGETLRVGSAEIRFVAGVPDESTVAD